ncbi:hypothetical protein [Bdellovibrio bacteriovorus]|uniref:hypothetical protein n=1 Tax=Bdellovibrio bacteriovorus TaxID=959 RepID=UPI0035A68128
MCSQVLKLSLIFLTYGSLAFASGGESAPAKEEPKEIKTSEESYAVVQARVAALEAKIRSGETEIAKLITAKQSAKDPAQVNEVIRQMITIHKDLEHNIKEYDQQRALLKYRYPEKGLAEKREYERIELKSIEEMESQVSLSASLNKTLRKVRTQYEAPEVSAETSKESAATKKKQDKKQPSLIDPVILQK